MPLSGGQRVGTSRGTSRGAAQPPPPSRTPVWLAVLSFLFALVGVFGFVGAAALTFMQPPEAEQVDVVEPAPVPAPPPVPVPTDGTPDEDVQPQPEPQQAPEPPPAPEPAGKAKAKAVEAAGPTLHVKSNRRALLYIDDEIKGYAPLTLPIAPGEHRIRAMIGGQPNSEQAKTVKVAPTAKDIRIEFTF
ncbi:MAG: hypothetical protein R2724_34920 [Bryobacterales bacterium]